MTARPPRSDDDMWRAAREDARAEPPMGDDEAEAIKRRAGRANADALREVIEKDSGERNDAA